MQKDETAEVILAHVDNDLSNTVTKLYVVGNFNLVGLEYYIFLFFITFYM